MMKQKTMKCGCVVEQYGDDDPELVHCGFHRRDPGQDIPPEWLDDDGNLIVTKFDEPSFWLEP
jgi:hypothetical protein